MKEHTLYALRSQYTSSANYDAKHMFSYLDFRVTLKLMVKITSIFGSYRFLRIAWHDIFSLSDHFPASWKLYIPHDLAESRRKCSSSRQSNPEVNHRTHLKDSSCLKFGKTSNRAEKNCRKEKSESEQRTLYVLIRIWSHRTSASVYFFGNDRSSHSRIQISLDPMSIYYEWASD